MNMKKKAAPTKTNKPATAKGHGVGRPPTKTSFKPGNKIWQLRPTNNLRPRIFKTPDDLWSAACEYFEWIENNPLLETKVFCQQGVVIRDEVPKARAMTLIGLSLFLGIGKTTLDLYRKREEFADVVEQIDAVIWSHKFEHAAADLMNPMIVARELGLKEAASHEHTGKDGGPIETADLTDFEKARRIAFYLAQAANQKAE